MSDRTMRRKRNGVESENQDEPPKRAKPSEKLNKLSQEVESLTEIVKSHSDTIVSLSLLPNAIQALSAKVDSMNEEKSLNWDEEPYVDGDDLEKSNTEDRDSQLLKILSLGEPAPEFGDPLVPCVANSFSNLTSHDADKDKVDGWKKKYKAPENCKLLCAPKVNPEIWNQLPNKAKQRDFQLQHLQSNISMATVAIGRAVEEIMSDDPGQDTVLSYLMECANILGCTSREMSMKRRNEIKQSINSDFSGICSTTTPITEYLFGDNVTEALKTAKATANVMRALKPGEPRRFTHTRGIGNRLNFRRPSYRGRGRPMFRGRLSTNQPTHFFKQN